MQLYSAADFELAKEKLGPIVEKIEKRKLELFEPTTEEQLRAAALVMQFIKDNKRKIYGGTAQNALVKDKKKEDAFYAEDKLPDIDFYSPDPIKNKKNALNITTKILI